MLHSYLKSAFRHLLRAKGYTFINVTGLGVGLALCVLILSQLRFENSFDSFWPDADRIFRVTSSEVDNGVERQTARAPARFSELLRTNVPGIEYVARTNGRNESVVSVQDEQYIEAYGLQADSDFLHLLGIELVSGSEHQALAEPFTTVLSTSLARKYFGNQEILDREIRIDGDSYRVTGVMPDLPANTHLTATYLTSLSTRRAKYGDATINEIESNWRAGATTYIKLIPGADTESVLSRSNALLSDHMADAGDEIRLGFQPLPDIHATSAGLAALLPGERPGNPSRLILLAALCGFILTIACVNFINLATARASTRLKEVGVRKASGASQRNLVVQFMCETFVVVSMAFGLSIFALELAEPLLTSAMRSALGTDVVPHVETGSTAMILWSAMVLAGTGLLAGLYPSIVLARHDPVAMLKGGPSSNTGSVLRNVLVTFQLVVSIVLLTGMLIAARQFDFIDDQDLGYDTEHVLIITARDHETFPGQYESFKEEVESLVSVAGVTASTSYGALGSQPAFGTESADEQLPFEWIGVDGDFVDATGLSIVAGRDFSEAESPTGFVVNESAVERLGLSPEQAIGREITYNRRRGPIVGVVADFHQNSLHSSIEPVVLYRIGPQARPFVLVRTYGGNPAQVMDDVERIWDQYQPHMPFEVSFLDDRVGNLYAADRQFRRIFQISSIVALILAVMGLFGLSAFTASRRTRELGIRKTLGATTLQLLGLLSGHYVRLAVFAIAVGSPLGWLVLRGWLSGFAYRVDIEWTLFARAGGVLLAVTLAAVSWHAVRAALANPVDCLRTE